MSVDRNNSHKKDGRPRISFRCFMFLAGYGTDNLLHYSYLNKWVKLDRITGWDMLGWIMWMWWSTLSEKKGERKITVYCIYV